tara:strand:+ start:244 stop:537 length:294 start_codon:yes stop_codon:yes gene_type:complete
MSKLSRKKVIKLIGKESALGFVFNSENMFTYETIIPTINDVFLNDNFIYSVTVFNDDGSTFFKYENLQDLIKESEILNIERVYSGGERETIYTQYKK